MKRVVIIIGFLIFIIASSMIGYLVVSANTKVETELNMIDTQNELQETFKSYGYTIENPNVILNPYKISPLTALIIFETPKEAEVTVIVEGKTEDTTYTNQFEPSIKHFIPIYGLYPDYNNTIKIICNDKEKIIEIKTEALPENLSNTTTNQTDKPLFITTDSNAYAIDKNNEIRWYLTKNYKGKISRLSNGHFLLSTDKKLENNYSTGLVEIDLLGKIYKEYKISSGYYGSYAELDNTLLVLSDDLLEIDKQTGTIINTIELSDTYNTVNIENDIIMLTNDTTLLKINNQTREQESIQTPLKENEMNLDFYTTDKNYELEIGVSFGTKYRTPTSDKNIFLINYKKIDEEYQNYNIKLTKETDRLVVQGDFSKEDEVYIILDKFLDKKVYEVDIKDKTTYKYINEEGLEGKYSIYIKINEKLYKTNKYVTF